jgi:16S rRNA processing protein RimM
LKCDPTNAGRIVFSPGVELRCEHAAGSSTVRVTHVRPHKGRLLIRLEGVDDANAAEAFAGATFYAPRERMEVEDGEYLDVDLIGCVVEGIDGTRYGPVERVEHFPASDMLVVNGRMVPMVHAFIREIDIPQKRIVIDPPKGLLDDEAIEEEPEA